MLKLGGISVFSVRNGDGGTLKLGAGGGGELTIGFDDNAAGSAHSSSKSKMQSSWSDEGGGGGVGGDGDEVKASGEKSGGREVGVGDRIPCGRACG